MADFEVFHNGNKSDKDSVEIIGDMHTTYKLVFKHKNGPAAAGRQVQVETSCVFMVSPVKGTLDSNGQIELLIGPSFGAKGNANLTVRVGTQAKSFDIRFI